MKRFNYLAARLRLMLRASACQIQADYALAWGDMALHAAAIAHGEAILIDLGLLDLQWREARR